MNNQLKLRRYTAEDQQIIINCINESPLNYNEAFRKAAELTNRTVNAIRFHYHNVIKLKYPVTTAVVNFETGKASKNGRKNSPLIAGKNLQDSQMQPIMVILTMYLKMNPDHQQKLYTVLKTLNDK